MFDVSTTSFNTCLANLSTALLIKFRGNSSQIDYRASFSSSMLFGYSWSIW